MKTGAHLALVVGTGLFLSLLGSLAKAQTTYQPVLEGSALSIPFDHYSTTDRFHRKIIFYVEKGDSKLPLALIVLGSGGQSVWRKVGEQIGGGLQSLLARTGKDRVRVVAVEKPGVEFGFQPPRPGSSEGCSETFLKEHTLDRWTEANLAAVRASLKLPNVDATRIVAIGHSEGGIVVAKLAADLPAISHVAVLAGGGPSQVEDLKISMPNFAEEWRKIEADPMNTQRFAWGHTYLRWSTFCASSTTAELLRSKAKIFLAAGSENRSVPVASFHKCCESLRAASRPFESVLVEGSDHGFAKPEDQGKPLGMQRIFGQILDWFLK